MNEYELANKLEKYYLRLSKQNTAYENNLGLVRVWKVLLSSDAPNVIELDGLQKLLESDQMMDGSAFYELEISLRKWLKTKR